MHKMESLVYLLKRHVVRHEFIDHNLLGHVIIDQALDAIAALPS